MQCQPPRADVRSQVTESSTKHHAKLGSWGRPCPSPPPPAHTFRFPAEKLPGDPAGRTTTSAPAVPESSRALVPKGHPVEGPWGQTDRPRVLRRPPTTGGGWQGGPSLHDQVGSPSLSGWLGRKVRFLGGGGRLARLGAVRWPSPGPWLGPELGWGRGEEDAPQRQAWRPAGTQMGGLGGCPWVWAQ